MSNLAPSGDPWRLLILDRDPADPKLILATVVELADVRPAWPGITPPDAMAEAVAWMRGRLVDPRPTLEPMPHVSVWRVDQAAE